MSSVESFGGAAVSRIRRALEALLALPGFLLLALAARATPEWFERHVVVPEFYLPPPGWMLPALRTVVALTGLLFVLVLRPLAGRAAMRLGPRETLAAAARISVAVLLSLAVCEGALRAIDKPDLESPHPRLESRLGVPDARLGWALTPEKTTPVRMAPQLPAIEYSVDALGDRAPAATFREDPARPTIVLTGESIAFGHGLPWRDTIAARLEVLTGAQVVVVAVGGYGSDQAYLRAVDALARLQRPIAVVTIVVPVQLSRNLHDYRPRLALDGARLVGRPARHARFRVQNLLANELRYMSDAKLAESLALTRAIFEATQRAAAARGARTLFVTPSFGAPAPALLASLLAGLPNAPVELASARILAYDGHPDPEGALQIARAIAQYVSSP